jgi:hypothetical protein
MTDELKKGGGPAFPLVIVKKSHGETGAPMESDVFSGLYARDYFAAAALQGDWASQDETSNGCFPNDWPSEQFEKRAAVYYRMADAMLAARGKS